MKKRALFAAGLIAFGAATFTACKDDDDINNSGIIVDTIQSINYCEFVSESAIVLGEELDDP